MSIAIAPLVAAYVLVAALLLSLNLTSRWAWPVKAGAVVLTTGFFALSYVGAVSLLGWPSRAKLPPHFQLLATKVVEPDAHAGTAGGVFLWIDPLDEQNLPLNRPRAFELPWSAKLSRKVSGAQEKLQQGQEVAGKAEAIDENDVPVDDIQRVAGPPPREGQEANGMDTVPFSDDGRNLQFEDMPPPILPEKGPI
ncbi:hypothetical protein NK718_13935 [Alsobacter sp. SYSU M60028]|uniref:Uncharacterized protein n=1 Tax=Alsobacter ponti TaxID=2962936 RepID=A0ABT1LFF0_9HYPH|nr:hypothetical protein [Alsobacter ponti]MCP8939623.1 hypothetical protein [Alsobacter ponti]